MKKLFALLLVSTLLLSLFVFPVGVSADGPETAATHVVDIGVDVETVSYGGKTYTVIGSVTEFLNMSPTDGKAYFILKQDLDFGTTNLPVDACAVPALSTATDFIFEGNGYALKNITWAPTANVGLFASCAGGTAEIRHLTIKNTEITSTKAYVGIMYSLLAENFQPTFKYVSIDADVTSSCQRTALYVAQSGSGTLTKFYYCTASGEWNYSAVHCGGFVGFCSAGELQFYNCSLDNALVYSSNNRIGGYIGTIQNNPTVTFNDCSATGTLIEKTNTKWLAGYVGAIWHATSVTTFNNCSSSVLICGISANAGFIGGFNITNPKVYFNGCEFDGTVISAGKAGGFTGENKPITLKGENIMSGTAISLTEGQAAAFNATGTPTEDTETNGKATVTGTVSVYSASAEAAYIMANAQLNQNPNVPTSYIYGYNISSPSGVAFGQPRVYKIDTKHSDAFYTNDYTGIEEVNGNAGKPAGNYQLKAGAADGTEDLRLILAIDAENLPLITSLSLNVQFGVVGGGTRKLTCDLGDVAIYWSVLGGDKVYEAADGYVLMAVVISDIPTAEWDRSVDVSLTVNAEAAEIYNYALNFDVAALAS